MKRSVFSFIIFSLMVASFCVPAEAQFWPGHASMVLTRSVLPANCNPGNGQIVYLQGGNRGIYSCTALNTWTRIDTSGVFNVKAFGAVGNGAADDITPIQNALDAANLVGGGTVFLPKGDYRISAPAAIWSNTTVRGDGYGTSIFPSVAAFPFIAAEAIPTTSVGSILYVRLGASNVIIENLRVRGLFDLGVPGFTFPIFDILLGRGSSNCIVRNTWITNALWSGICARGSGHLIEESFATDNAVDGFESWASNVRIVANQAYNNGRSVLAGFGIEILQEPSLGDVKGILVSANLVVLGAGGIAIDNAADDVVGVLVSGNTLNNIDGRAINATSAAGTITDLSIVGNSINLTTAATTFGNGVTIGNNVSGFIISSNRIQDTDTGAGPSSISIEGSAANGYVIGNNINKTWVGIASIGTGVFITVANNFVSDAPGAHYVSTNGRFFNNLDEIGTPADYFPNVEITGNLTMTGVMLFTGVTFAALGAPANGTVRYCSDCTIASPCAAGATGAIAKRLNGVWICN